MKALYMTFLIVVACCVSSEAQLVDTASQETVKALSQAAASQDVQGVLRLLPRLERLQDQDPEAYLRAVMQALPVLRASTSADAKQASMGLSSNVLATPNPADIATAAPVFALKRKIVLESLNLEEVRKGKAQLTEIARFVGEVRSRMIPGYTNRGTAHPGFDILMKAGVMDASLLTDPAQKEAYAKAVRDNEQDMLMNKLQLELHSTNEILTFHLLHCAARFPDTNPANSDFVKAVVDSAHLTATESKGLAARDR
jgi:hypothetical protein